MANSDFWHDLAIQFRELDPYGFVRADWLISISELQQSLARWTVTGREPTRSGFETLARRGGREIDLNADSLGVWLETLKSRHINFTSEGSGIKTNDVGTVLGQHFYGTISQVAEASMQLCYRLESEALDSERLVKLEEQQRNNPVHWPYVVRQWEAFKALKKLASSHREEIPEAFLRTILSIRDGCKPEDITPQQIQAAFRDMVGHYESAAMLPLQGAAQDETQSVDETEAEVHPKEPMDQNSLVNHRQTLLADYKAATGNPSSYRIYLAQNSGINKPEFYEWAHGRLPQDSKTTKKFEKFLLKKKPPISKKN